MGSIIQKTLKARKSKRIAFFPLAREAKLDNCRFRERQLNNMRWQLLLFDGVAGKGKY